MNVLELAGRGIYSVPEASRLSGVPAGRIRRWLGGYSYAVKNGKRRSPEVVVGDFGTLTGGDLALSFRDLIEVRFVDAFRKHGVSWRCIRIAADRAQAILNTSHPFSTRRFQTDGKTILANLVREHGEDLLLDLVKDQFAIKRILAAHLYRGLEFSSDDLVMRWWPVEPRRVIVIDPTRGFGQPILNRDGVPTAVIARAVRAEGAIDPVAAIYEISLQAVRAACDFEERLAA